MLDVELPKSGRLLIGDKNGSKIALDNLTGELLTTLVTGDNTLNMDKLSSDNTTT